MAEKKEQTKRQAVFTTIRRNERTLWVRIGTAFTNRDGSLNVVLDALPVDGRLHIREVTAAEQPKDGASDDANEVAA